MKTYVIAAVMAALFAIGWWLRLDAVRDFEAKLEAVNNEHAVAMEKAKREHDETRRRLSAETRARMDAVSRLPVGDCYRLDDPLPDNHRRLLDPGNR